MSCAELLSFAKSAPSWAHSKFWLARLAEQRKEQDKNRAQKEKNKAEKKAKAKIAAEKAEHITKVLYPAGYVQRGDYARHQSVKKYLKKTKSLTEKEAKKITRKNFIEKWSFYMEPKSAELDEQFDEQLLGVLMNTDWY